MFNISKVPDIYDCIKYDHLHNKSIFRCPEAEELYTYAKNMADVVIPQVLSVAVVILGNKYFDFFIRKVNKS